MLIGLESTIAEVRNVKKARKILDEYYIEGVEFAIDDKKNMRAIVVEDAWCDLPWAVKVEQLPDRDQFPDEDSWGEAMVNLEFDDGFEGFENLLVELAPCLKTPLMIIARADDDCQAFVWRIEPGAAEVERLGV